MSRERILFLGDVASAVAAAVLVGAAAVLFAGVPSALALAPLVLGTAMLAAFWRVRAAMVAGIFFVALSASMVWSIEKTDLSWTEEFAGEAFEGRAVISGSATQEKYAQRVPFRFEVCEAPESCRREKAFLRTEKWEKYRVGEVLRVSCVWEVPERDEETGTDWMRIFAARGPVLFCRDDTPERTGEHEASWRSALAGARTGMEDRLAQIFPYPESALGAGLLFGGTEGMSEEWEEKFSQTSMTHIVAVSGYNISLLVSYLGVFAAAVGVRRQHAWILSIVGITAFVALIGFPASGVRAGVMGVLAYLAVSGGMTGAGLRALVFASAIMVIFNPFLIRHDVGFQLSVLATLGIILGSPLAIRFGMHKLPILMKIPAEIAVITFFAQLFVIPVILITFESFSFLSFLANLLVLWTIPLAMLSTFAALVASVFGVLAGSIVSVPAAGILAYDLAVIDWLSRFEAATIIFSGWGMGVFAVYYTVVLGGFGWYFLRERSRTRRRCEAYTAQEA